MASVAVTPVTAVTNGERHACHAPAGRDISRDIAEPPYVVGGSHVTHVTRADFLVTGSLAGHLAILGDVTLRAFVTPAGAAR